MATEKKATSIRLTQEARRLLAVLAEALGLTQSGVMEIAIREMAKREWGDGNEKTKRNR